MGKIISILILTLILNGCKKYDEGPLFSLRSKVSRIEGNWKVSSYIANGIDQTSYFDGIKWSFAKDGKLVFTYNGTVSIHSWKFQDNKNKIRIVLNSNVYDYEIKELKNEELKFMGTNFNINEELVLNPF